MTSFLRNLRETLTPPLQTSSFLTRGVLTPSEFVTSGDNLIYKCPTWCWESGSASGRVGYLPEGKQFLVTRGVPCLVRCVVESEGVDIEGGIDDEDVEWSISAEKLGGEFVDVDGFANDDEPQPKPIVKKVEEKAAPVVEVPKKDTVEEEEEDEYADMSTYFSNTLDLPSDPSLLPPTSTTSNTTTTKESNIIKTRTYDISITYSKYYQTPRIYLRGYDELGQPLTGDEMMEDVMLEYRNTTVTIERHPHEGGEGGGGGIGGWVGAGGDFCISVHPCQHGRVMKSIVTNLIINNPAHTPKIDASSSSSKMEGKKTISDYNVSEADVKNMIDNYMFIFLKFVSSIIPTVNYDFTVDAKLG